MTITRINNRNRRAFYPSVFDNVFESFLNDADWNQAVQKPSKPKANVLETEAGFEIEFAIPGFDKSEVSISVEENVLSVSGSKKEASEEGTWNRREFTYSDFKRSFTLSDNINQEDVTAVFANGILTVSLPKKEVVKPKSKQIEIQ